MNIYLTLDYELFMGEEVGSVDNCLIKPTERLISILRPHGIKATFFVDASYLYALNKNKRNSSILQNDFEKITNQLHILKNEGHSIQLHIHPQWYYAIFNGVHWILDDRYYKLSDFPKDIIQQLFIESKNLLETITGDEINAFRAGGFSLQSYNWLDSLFSDSNILIDSSVLPNKFCDDKIQFYDFRSIHNCNSYRFTSNIVNSEANGKFLEIPISTYKLSFLQYCKLYILFKLNRRDKNLFGDGKPINRYNDKKRSRLKKILSVNSERIIASIDTGLITFLKQLYNNSHKSNDFVIIGHPKNLSDYSLNKLDNFLNATKGDIYKIFMLEEEYETKGHN